MTQNQIAYHTLQETIRSNQAREGETTRSNVARETETRRSNIANELLKHLQNVEAGRHNKATEVETNRTNVANELISDARNQETHRHNVVSEITQGADMVIDALGDLRGDIIDAGTAGAQVTGNIFGSGLKSLGSILKFIK